VGRESVGDRRRHTGRRSGQVRQHLLELVNWVCLQPIPRRGFGFRARGGALFSSLVPSTMRPLLRGSISSQFLPGWQGRPTWRTNPWSSGDRPITPRFPEGHPRPFVRPSVQPGRRAGAAGRLAVRGLGADFLGRPFGEGRCRPGPFPTGSHQGAAWLLVGRAFAPLGIHQRDWPAPPPRGIQASIMGVPTSELGRPATRKAFEARCRQTTRCVPGLGRCGGLIGPHLCPRSGADMEVGFHGAPGRGPYITRFDVARRPPVFDSRRLWGRLKAVGVAPSPPLTGKGIGRESAGAPGQSRPNFGSADLAPKSLVEALRPAAPAKRPL